jgi:membrane-associated PAP2 superfamily phosphatase
MLIKHLSITLIFIFLTLIIFQFTEIDIIIQDHLFNFELHKWLIDKKDKFFKFIFYDGVKVLLILFTVSILFILIFSKKLPRFKEYRFGLSVVALSMIIVPSVVGGIKAISNIPCPKNIEHYGGNYPNIGIFDSYPIGFEQKKRIKCFPAGHSSGGFALMSLFFLFKSKKNRQIALISTLTLGWIMGIYKMMIGEHYLSHTIISMLLAWFLILLIYGFLSKFEKK